MKVVEKLQVDAEHSRVHVTVSGWRITGDGAIYFLLSRKKEESRERQLRQIPSPRGVCLNPAKGIADDRQSSVSTALSRMQRNLHVRFKDGVSG